MNAGIQRGDVVVVDFAPTQPNAGVRPALIVQNDRDNNRTTNTIVAQITSNISRAHEPTQFLIDQNHPDWLQSGLHRPSVATSLRGRWIPKSDSDTSVLR